ncbi:COMM domain-containing protein 5-like [Watersipora subatra]|uniref:COMM domain-containing protein 5-like n=1 Tax=Watersipora subatra TaxID=2589382 RepID=UPI00355B45E2
MSSIGPTRSGKKDRSYDIERVPFYGMRVPANIAAIKKLAPKLERATFQKLLRLALLSIEGKAVQPEMFNNLVSPTNSLEMIHVAYAGVLKIIQAAFRCSSTSLPVENFSADLKGLNLSAEMISDLSSAVYGSRRSVLETATVKNVPKHVSIVDFKWKINVSISTTSLNRVLEPSVSTRMTLSNGEVKCFEMSVAKFQELRYNVASVMKEMEDLERRNILKIED